MTGVEPSHPEPAAPGQAPLSAPLSEPLSGRRIVVSGGTTGIGRASVLRLAQAGARLITFGREQAPLDETLALARQAGGEVHGLVADTCLQAQVDKVFAAADERLGGIDILLACAGLGAEPLHEMDNDAWRYVVDTNLSGALACAKAAIERMRAQGGGHVVLVGSISPHIQSPGESVYAATKAGLQAFAETARKELAQDNVRISLVEPGSVGTDMQECGPQAQREAIARHEMLRAEEIAEALLFVMTRPENCDVVSLRIEPRLQKH